MKIEKTGIIKAPIELVFECLTDITYYKKETAKHISHEKPKFQYNQKEPFGVNNKIRVLTDQAKIVLTVVNKQSPNLLELMISPPKDYEDKLGCLNYTAQLNESEGKTKYCFIYESTKNPTDFPRFLVWIIYLYLKVSLFYANRRFIKYVKSKNV